VRIAPNEVAVADIDSHRQIHRIGTPFIKSPWYQNQTPTQFDDDTCGVFGVRDPRKAHARRKLYQQAGTRVAVHGWEPRIVEIVNQAMDKIGKDLKETGKADVFKWFIMMTTDVLGELAFGEPFRMVEKAEVGVWYSCILRRLI
jgi:cytochrome P450